MNRLQRLFAISIASLLAACAEQEAAVEVETLLATAERGPMRVTVREGAEITAHQMTNIKNEVEGRRNTLIYLIPEGTIVEKGQKLAEIDVSELEERRADQEIKLEQARAALVQAKKKLEIQLKEILASEQTAQSKLTIAELGLEKFVGKTGSVGDVKSSNAAMVKELDALVEGTVYVELVGKVRALLGDEKNVRAEMGEMAQQILAQIDQVRLAASDLKLKETTLAYSKQLFAKRYISRNEFDQDDLKRESQLSKTYLTMNELDLLISYALKKDQIRLTQDVRNARLGLEKVLATNKAKRAREKAEFKSKEAEFNLSKERFDNLVYQIDHGAMYAPTPGVVIYARLGRHGRDMIEEGQEIRERQTIIHLPDLSQMVAMVKVHEADINKVASGQPVTIFVDAFPDETFRGRVNRVAPLPDSGSRWMNDQLRVYKTKIDIEGRHEGLRPGMSATVEIDVGTIPDALLLPVAAVHVQKAVTYVWQRTAAGPKAVPVKLGEANVTHVQVLEGLDDGAEVYLSLPPGAEAPKFEQPEQIKPAPVEAVTKRGGKRPAEASAPMSREDRRQLMDKIRALLVKKFPDREELKEPMGWMRAMRDPEIQAALEEDPEISAMWQRMRSARRGGGERGRGMGRRRGEGSGDERGRGAERRRGEGRDRRSGKNGREKRD